MTTLWLRIGLMVALIAAIFVGIWDFFRAPSVETAVAAVIPTVEEVERAKEITGPVVRFVSEQDAESVALMLHQAEQEFQSSLSHPGAPVEVINKVVEVPGLVKSVLSGADTTREFLRPHAPAEHHGVSTVEPGRPPGIEWYRDH